MSSEDAIDVGQALDTLVHQFADPWSFLRELIQNAIDAGSPEIDVRIEHEPPKDPSGEDPGLMIVEISDAGDGMDRQIIDTRLTRLFSSAKDGDYTKIGRFGIGFVSVFAIEPDMVCVDTGRAGEYWRVLFAADRSFERIVLDTPVEGTTIRIYKRASAQEVEQARARARRVLDYWCKHARVEIRCDDELISRPMALDARCVIEHDEDQTHVLLGYVEQPAGLRGYYHAGLTLHEEVDESPPHIAFKIDSRYLEHTLTRDNVIRDESFDKAMAIVASLTRGPLLERLGRELEQAARSGREDEEVEFLRRRLFGELLELDKDSPVRHMALVPTIHGEPLSLAACVKASRSWYRAPRASPVSEALHRDRKVVVRSTGRGALDQLIDRVTQRPPRPASSLVTATPATKVEREAWQPLRKVLGALLEGLGHKLADISLGHLAYPDSPVADHVAITQAKLGELTPVEEIGELGSGWFASRRTVVVNADHPTIHHLLELAPAEPELAAYLLLKLFYLRTELRHEQGHELDTKLTTMAAEARWARSTN